MCFFESLLLFSRLGDEKRNIAFCENLNFAKYLRKHFGLQLYSYSEERNSQVPYYTVVHIPAGADTAQQLARQHTQNSENS